MSIRKLGYDAILTQYCNVVIRTKQNMNMELFVKSNNSRQIFERAFFSFLNGREFIVLISKKKKKTTQLVFSQNREI